MEVSEHVVLLQILRYYNTELGITFFGGLHTIINQLDQIVAAN